MFTKKFNHEDKEFTLEQASLEYLSCIDPSFEWNRRGFKASNYDRESSKETQNKIKEKLKQNLIAKDLQDLEDFKKKSLEIYKNFKRKNTRNILGNLTDRQWYFILGIPRTGGTYILKELFELQNKSLKQFNKKMTGDGIPAGHALITASDSDENFRRSIHAVSQWVLWCRQELNELSFIPKKHIGFTQILPTLDSIFGEQSTYIITHRRPGASFSSYKTRFHPKKEGYTLKFEGYYNIVAKNTDISKKQWKNMPLKQKYLFYWASTYMQIATLQDLKGQIVTLNFGQEHEKFIKHFARKKEIEHDPEPFTPSNRRIDSFWNSEQVIDIKNRVNAKWKNRFNEKLVETDS